MKNNNSIFKIVLIVIAALFLLHQLFSSLISPIKTVTANYDTAVSGIDISAVIVRNETVIENGTSGANHFLISDGERVAKGGVIADVYSSESDSMTVTKLNTLEAQLNDMNNIIKYNEIQEVNIDLLNSKISENLMLAINKTQTDKYSSSNEYIQKLLTVMNRKASLIDPSFDFNTQINELNSQISALKSSLKQPLTQITANESGFFVSSVDGYENTLLTDDLSVYTTDFLNNITSKKEETANSIGKLVSDYRWYIVATVDSDIALKYKLGDKVTLKTSIKENPNLSVTVAQINGSFKTEKTVIVFSCQEMNRGLASMRFANMQIIEGEYSGLVLPKSAVRVNNGVTGVYTVSGMQLKFVGVEILYNDGETIICKKNEDVTKTDCLRLYDKVVVKGRNLYDGKIVD